MKILVVNTVTFRRNGITGVILNLYKKIDKRQIQMDFVATDHKTEDWVKEFLIDSGSNLYEIDKTYKHIIKYIYDLARIVKNYDVIHVHGNSSSMVFELLAAKIVGVKIRIAHSHNTTCSSPVLDKMLRPLFYSFCNGRLACGDDAGKWLFEKRQYKVINNGIDAEKFKFDNVKRLNLRKELDVENKIVIGHVGRLNEQKNQSFLLDVFNDLCKKTNDIVLLLIGDGPLEENLKTKANGLGISDKVIFLGAVNNVNDYLNAIDLIVMPSLYEGLPLTIVEEQANALKCLCSSSITKECNLTGNVMFLNLEDGIATWSEKIIQIISQKETKRGELSSCCIEKIQNAGFDINTSANELKMIYLKSWN